MSIRVIVSTPGGSADVTRYVGDQSLQIVDQLNVPTTCDFTLFNIDPFFTVPQQGAYVQVFSDKYNLYPFTGYVTVRPERTFMGMNPAATQPTGKIYQYHVKATSDEYLLNNKATPFIPVFVNQTKGKILGTLVNQLVGSGFFDVTSQAASGDTVPFYQYDPSQSFSAIAKTFADDSRYRYKFNNKKFIFQPYAATPFPIKYDTTLGQGTFDPNLFTVNVLDTPLINDVLVIGDPEAGAYGDAIFVGDGFNSNFPLGQEVFRGETQMLLEEDWTGSNFNTQYWTVVDPGGNFSLFQGALNVVGGTGVGSSYILGNNGVELGGQLYLQHGQFIFTKQNEGIIGGVYTDSSLSTSSCYCGFSCSVSGASAAIQPLLQGGTVGPTVLANPSHQYILINMITGNQQFRYNRAFRTQSGQQFGGDLVPSDGIITWAIYDIDPLSFVLGDIWQYIPQYQIPILTTILTTYTIPVSGMPGLGLYAPVNSGHLNGTSGGPGLNFSANTLMVAQPPQATLLTYSVPASAGVIQNGTQQALGFGLLPTLQKQVASLVQGADGSTSQLSFYNDTIPKAQEVIELRYRVAQQAMSRVIDPVSIAQQAALVGDDGHRGSIQTKLSPMPRSSEECDRAGQAFITDAENSVYTGSYVASYYFTNYAGSGFPVPGTYMMVRDPDRGITTTGIPGVSGQPLPFLVQKVTTQYIELKEEIANHTVEFGQDTYLARTLNQFVTFPNTLVPQDTAIAPLPQTLVGLGSVTTSGASAAFLHDLDKVTVGGITCTGAFINFGVVPVTGVEVRTSDIGWGTTTVHNLFGVFSQQINLIPRTQDVMRYYMRQSNGRATSRRTTIVEINCQLPPPQITGYLNMTNYDDPLLVVNAPLNLQDFFGTEIRAADNKTIIFHRDFLAQSDLVFHLNTAPNWPGVQRNPVFNLYAYNLIGCFGPGSQVSTSGLLGLSGGPIQAPQITNIQVNAITDVMTWDVILQPLLQDAKVYYNVEVDTTGTAMFINPAVSAFKLQARNIYLGPAIVGAEFDTRIQGFDYAGQGPWAFYHWPGALFVINPGATGASGGACLANVTNLAATASLVVLPTSGAATTWWQMTFSYTEPPSGIFEGVTVYIRNYLGQKDWRRWWTKEKHASTWSDVLIPTGETVDIAFVSFDTNGVENSIPYSPMVQGLHLVSGGDCGACGNTASGPKFVGSVNIANQNNSIGSTQIFTPAKNGPYEVFASAECQTSVVGASAQFFLTYQGINGNVLTDTLVPTLDLSATDNRQSKVMQIYAETGTPVDYYTTYSPGVSGQPTYLDSAGAALSVAGTSVSAALSAPAAVGDMLVVTMTCGPAEAPGVVNCTDNAGSTYASVPVSTIQTTGDAVGRVPRVFSFATLNAVAGAQTVTVTSVSAALMRMIVGRYSHVTGYAHSGAGDTGTVLCASDSNTQFVLGSPNPVCNSTVYSGDQYEGGQIPTGVRTVGFACISGVTSPSFTAHSGQGTIRTSVVAAASGSNLALVDLAFSTPTTLGGPALGDSSTPWLWALGADVSYSAGYLAWTTVTIFTLANGTATYALQVEIEQPS